MSETRPPEAMPADWTVGSFSHEKGFGTLRQVSGEEVNFSIDSWNLGSIRPNPKDVARTGADSPLLPQPGEPVSVQWRRSATGRNVPRLVQPTGRVSFVPRTFDLNTWLAGIREHGKKLNGLSTAALLDGLVRVDEGYRDWSQGKQREAWEYIGFLVDVASLTENHDDFRPHAGWIYEYDHRWDREDAAQRLPAMLGLAPGSVPTAGDGYRTGGEQSLSEYAAACNAAARAAGGSLRLHEVDTHGDNHLFVCLPPAAFEALVSGGYVEPLPE